MRPAACETCGTSCSCGGDAWDSRALTHSPERYRPSLAPKFKFRFSSANAAGLVTLALRFDEGCQLTSNVPKEIADALKGNTILPWLGLANEFADDEHDAHKAVPGPRRMQSAWGGNVRPGSYCSVLRNLRAPRMNSGICGTGERERKRPCVRDHA